MKSILYRRFYFKIRITPTQTNYKNIYLENANLHLIMGSLCL